MGNPVLTESLPVSGKLLQWCESEICRLLNWQLKIEASAQMLPLAGEALHLTKNLAQRYITGISLGQPCTENIRMHFQYER